MNNTSYENEDKKEEDIIMNDNDNQEAGGSNDAQEASTSGLSLPYVQTGTKKITLPSEKTLEPKKKTAAKRSYHNGDQEMKAALNDIKIMKINEEEVNNFPDPTARVLSMIMNLHKELLVGQMQEVYNAFEAFYHREPFDYNELLGRLLSLLDNSLSGNAIDESRIASVSKIVEEIRRIL